VTDDAATTPTSLHDELLAAGAHANPVDLQALIMSLQNRITSLEGERGVPSDPIAGAVKNLIDHVKSRISQHPKLDASELMQTLETLPETVTTAHASLIKTLIDEVMLKHVQIAHDVAYWPELAMTLTKAVAKAAVTAAPAVVPTVAAAV
jgi:hypothetical protein